MDSTSGKPLRDTLSESRIVNLAHIRPATNLTKINVNTGVLFQVYYTCVDTKYKKHDMKIVYLNREACGSLSTLENANAILKII